MKKKKKDVKKKKEMKVKKVKKIKQDVKMKKKIAIKKEIKTKKPVEIKKQAKPKKEIAKKQKKIPKIELAPEIEVVKEELPITAPSAEEEKEETEEEFKEEPEEDIIEEEEKPIRKAVSIKKEDPLKNDVEALLFSSGKPVPEEMLCQLTGRTRREIKKVLEALKEDYDLRDTALMILQDADAWKITVRERHLPLVQKIVADTELTRATLETLAVIAYKSPVLQSTVIKTRGTGAYDHITELLNLGFITREKEGRSFKIKLAEKFFEYFDVEGNKDIKEALKAAKRPEPTTQKKLGDLEVVDVAAGETPEASQQAGKIPEQEKENEIIESEEATITPEKSGEDEEPEEDTDSDDDENKDEDTEKMLEDVEKEIDDLTKDDKEETGPEEEKEDAEEDETEDKEEEQEEPSDEELEEEPKYKKKKRF